MGAPVPYRVDKITPLNNLNPFVTGETLEHKEVTFERTPGIFPRKSAPSVMFPYVSIEISQIMWQKIAQKCPKLSAFCPPRANGIRRINVQLLMGSQDRILWTATKNIKNR